MSHQSSDGLFSSSSGVNILHVAKSNLIPSNEELWKTVGSDLIKV